jgi:hypothetical protein
LLRGRRPFLSEVEEELGQGLDMPVQHERGSWKIPRPQAADAAKLVLGVELPVLDAPLVRTRLPTDTHVLSRALERRHPAFLVEENLCVLPHLDVLVRTPLGERLGALWRGEHELDLPLPSLFGIPPHAVLHQDEDIDIAVRPRVSSRNRAKHCDTEHLGATCQLIDKMADFPIHGLHHTAVASARPGCSSTGCSRRRRNRSAARCDTQGLVIESFAAAHELPGITVAVVANMMSEANHRTSVRRGSAPPQNRAFCAARQSRGHMTSRVRIRRSVVPSCS